ncbi:MAG: aminotransferase class V-fold PLP-dependent enzyme [Defluviitaleaceae bacterium]|nr:aminotransferase class V-fold PLP-dependent enzyme [Defluviitaleaceae bacterium]
MIYFDNAAATPVSACAAAAAADTFGNLFGNSFSPHAAGFAAELAVKNSKCFLAQELSCKPDELFFLSSGSEANRFALCHAARSLRKKNGGSHIACALGEHQSVEDALTILRGEGFCVTYSPPDLVSEYVNENTVLAAVSEVSNETGHICDIKKFCVSVKKINPRTAVFADGVQGFCKLRAPESFADLYTFSGHKVHALKGIGGVAARNGLSAQLAANVFSSSENTTGILSLAAAAKFLSPLREKHFAHVKKINEKISSLEKILPRTQINALPGETSPYVLSMSFFGIKGETLVNSMSARGICASMGAACRVKKSGVTPLERLGFNEDVSGSAVRFSFSYINTLDEADEAVKIIIGCVNDLRGLE